MVGGGVEEVGAVVEGAHPYESVRVLLHADDLLEAAVGDAVGVVSGIEVEQVAPVGTPPATSLAVAECADHLVAAQSAVMCCQA